MNIIGGSGNNNPHSHYDLFKVIVVLYYYLPAAGLGELHCKVLHYIRNFINLGINLPLLNILEVIY